MDIDIALQKEEEKQEKSRRVHEPTSFSGCALACCETYKASEKLEREPVRDAGGWKNTNACPGS
jgi:hypothetical protein